MSLIPRGSKGRKPSKRQRAADGSMPLVEHLFEFRARLFKAVLGIVVGMIIALIFSKQILAFLQAPYLDAIKHLKIKGDASLLARAPTDYLIIQLKTGLYAGLILSTPVWLYQLWAFITPGLHKNERRWAYTFVAAAVPLFLLGAALAYLVIAKALEFLLPGNGSNVTPSLDIDRYLDFVLGLLVLFGCGFEFPLIVVMLNFAGIVSAKRLLGWWRIAVFLMFAFAAVVTPTPDPFTMTALALPMCLLYFVAVIIASANDRRKERAAVAAGFGSVSDDEASQLDLDQDTIEPYQGEDVSLDKNTERQKHHDD